MPRGVEPDLLAEPDPAGVRPCETGHGAEHRRLAGAGRPDERDCLVPDLELEL